MRRLHGLRRGRGHGFREEVQPALPVATRPHVIQQLVVQRTMRLEEQAWVEQRLMQQTIRDKLKHDQQPADTAIAVKKWMDRLELDVGKRSLDQRRRRLRLVVQEALELIEACTELVRRRRYERSVAGARPTGPHTANGEIPLESSTCREGGPGNLGYEGSFNSRTFSATRSHAAIRSASRRSSASNRPSYSARLRTSWLFESTRQTSGPSPSVCGK